MVNEEKIAAEKLDKSKSDKSLYDIVEKMRHDRTLASRNKNFEAFFQPSMYRALHLHRHLRALERDLLGSQQDGSVAVQRRVNPAGKIEIKIDIKKLRGSRTAHISPREYNMLVENPAIKTILESTAP